jgi:hypothetical protein
MHERTHALPLSVQVSRTWLTPPAARLVKARRGGRIDPARRTVDRHGEAGLSARALRRGQGRGERRP